MFTFIVAAVVIYFAWKNREAIAGWFVSAKAVAAEAVGDHVDDAVTPAQAVEASRVLERYYAERTACDATVANTVPAALLLKKEAAQ